ncbi:TPA: KilA-N domain-containing protein [Escherichia coli]|nr:KilA-N domain-containing protein [Escherichia coli]
MKTHLMPFLFKHPISTRIKGGVEQFSLTDIWKLSGMGEEKRPSKWLATQHAQKQIAYIEFLAEIRGNLNGRILPIETGKGRYSGTWGIKELAISYAMWLSPEYHVEVVKGFAEYEDAKKSRRNIKGLHRNVTDALKDTRAEKGKETKGYHYSTEAFMINTVLVGMNYREWLKLNGLEDAGFRNALNDEQLSRLEELEQYDAFLIEEGVEYTERKEKLEAKNKRIIQRKIKVNSCNACRKLTKSTMRQINKRDRLRYRCRH